MPIKIRCPHCQATLEVKETSVTGSIRCVRCHQPVPVGAQKQPTGDQRQPNEPATTKARKSLSDDDVLAFLGSPKT